VTTRLACSDLLGLHVVNTRLACSDEQINKLKKLFLCNSNRQYHFFHNSSKNSRGVAILVATNLDPVVVDEYRDETENALGLLVKLQNREMFLCSIYGPNHNDSNFFEYLNKCLDAYANYPCIIGGDWNLTYSASSTLRNPDIINMVNPPSTIRSGWLHDICDKHSLIDPFRAFHPTAKDFTYMPYGNRKCRSRIDFFLISASLLTDARNCWIPNNLSCNSFDHKPVFLDFTRNKVKTKPYINRTITNNPRTDDVVLAAYADTYLAHADPIQPAEMNPYVHRAGAQDPVDTLDDRLRLDRSTARYIYKAKNGKLVVVLTPSQKAKLIFE
jgi:exonuclease III